MPTVPFDALWWVKGHFFDSIAFLLILFLSVVFIQVLKNRFPLKKSQFSTVYIQQVTYKTVLQYHVTEYITQFWGHIIQNPRCQSTRYAWLKMYYIFLNSSEAPLKMRLLKWKAHLWLRGCPHDDYQIFWLIVKDNTIISLGPANAEKLNTWNVLCIFRKNTFQMYCNCSRKKCEKQRLGL